MGKTNRARKPAPKPAPKRSISHLSKFDGDRHNPRGVRCGNCGVVFPEGKSQEATIQAHLEAGCAE